MPNLSASEVIGLVIIVAVLAASVPSIRRELQRKRLLERAPVKHIGEVRDGELASVRGIVRARGALVAGPITGRAGVFTRYRILAASALSHPRLLKAAEERRPFEVVEDGRAVVLEVGAVVDWRSGFEHEERVKAGNLTAAHRSLLDAAKIEVPTPEEGLVPDYVFEEAVLAEGEAVRVVGRASIEVDPQGEGESPRSQPVRWAFGGTKDEPVFLERVSGSSARG